MERGDFDLVLWDFIKYISPWSEHDLVADSKVAWDRFTEIYFASMVTNASSVCVTITSLSKNVKVL